LDPPARWQVLVSGQPGRIAMPSPPMRAPAPDHEPSAIQAETPPPQHTPVPAGRWPLPALDLSVSADALVLLGICGWLIWRRFLRQMVLSRFGFLLGSQQNARYLVELLAQVAVLTGASRVALGTFYNPELLTTGYGYTRVAILSCYVAPGRLPLDVESRSMPMERIRADVQDLLDHAAGGWRLVEAGPHLPTPCLDYLLRNRIAFLYGRLVMLETLPIGILNLHFDTPQQRPADLGAICHADRLETLFAEISLVVRGRILRPSLWRRLLRTWSGH
jgi:hypothetical protein